MTLVVLTEKGDQLEPFAKANDPNAKQQSKSKWTAHSNILNEDLVLVCASGHLLSLDNPDDYDEKYEKWDLGNLPITINKFKYHFSGGKANKLFKQIKTEVEKADGVILATDPDQEGELIGRLILDRIPGGLSKLKYRLWNSSLTIGASKKAFENLDNPQKHALLKDSGQSRQFADWLVGMNLTRMASISLQSLGYRGVFSVGRVQTPILTLIIANDESIKNFKPKDYYQLAAKANVNGKSVEFINSEKYYDQGRANDYLNGVVSGTLVRSNTLKITKVDKKHLKKNGPKLFVLSDVQGLAAKQYGFSPDRVMNLIENMYLRGFLSYTRPDSHFINVDEFNLLKQHLQEYQDLIDFKFNPEFLEPRKQFVKDASKIEGHSALEPTEKLPQKSDLSEDEWKIYRLIVQRILLMFAPDFEYDETKIKAQDNNDNEYTVTGRVITNGGWRSLTNSLPKGNELPNLESGKQFNADFGLKKKTTTVPKRITQSSLVGTILPKYSLGTQATRASIIEELINTRKYIKMNKKQELFPTDQGRIIYDFMHGTVYTKPLTTAKWDKDLKEISRGKQDKETFLNSIKDNINKTLLEYQSKKPELTVDVPDYESRDIKDLSSEIVCPKCKKGHLQLISGKNKQKKKYSMYSCNRYPDCKFSLPGSFSGKKLEEKDILSLIDNGKTEVLTLISKKGKKYQARLSLNNNKLNPEFID